MTKKEFIEKFDLTKTDLKAIFSDGMAEKSRTIYERSNGLYYVFYGNDLYTFTPYRTCKCFNHGKEICGKIGAGYGWYH